VPRHRAIDCLWTTTNWEKSLDELVQELLFCHFRCDGENVFDEKILKAGMLDASSFSTNFNTYGFGIVDAVAQQLLYESPKPPAVERWGVVAELLNALGHVQAAC
jgi:hypothetical protein